MRKEKEDKLGEKEKFLRSTSTPPDIYGPREKFEVFFYLLEDEDRSKYGFLIGFGLRKPILNYNSLRAPEHSKRKEFYVLERSVSYFVNYLFYFREIIIGNGVILENRREILKPLIGVSITTAL